MLFKLYAIVSRQTPQYGGQSVCWKSPAPSKISSGNVYTELSECSAPGQTLIWDLCSQFWTHKHLPWPPVNIGTIMGCGAIRFSTPESCHPGADRLYQDPRQLVNRPDLERAKIPRFSSDFNPKKVILGASEPAAMPPPPRPCPLSLAGLPQAFVRPRIRPLPPRCPRNGSGYPAVNPPDLSVNTRHEALESSKFVRNWLRDLPQLSGVLLYRILISEAAYLIWKIRCERAFGRDDLPASGHTDREIYTRWYKTISTRLTLDRTMTRKRFGRRAVPTALVRNTWAGCLYDEKGLPDDWLTQPEVLVGMAPRSTGANQ
ncbi:hypothetical protein BKA93DRAFT_754380 [Sparassis latifolia]